MYIYIYSPCYVPVISPTFHALKPGPRQMFLLWTIRLRCKRPRRRGGRMISFQLPGRGFLAIQPGLFFAFFCGCWTSPEKNWKRICWKWYPRRVMFRTFYQPLFKGGIWAILPPKMGKHVSPFGDSFHPKRFRQGRELRHFSFIFSRLPQLTNKMLGAALINDFVGIYHKFWNWTRYFSEYRRSLL